MAIIRYTGFEEGIANTQVLDGGLIGTSSIQSTVKRSGGYAFQANPVTIDTGSIALLPPAAEEFWTQFYFRFTTKPAANNEPIFEAYRTGSSRFEIRLTSAGKLQIRDQGGNQIGSDGATTLSANTWYRIWVHVKASDGSGQVSINGTSEFSFSAANLGAGSGNYDDLYYGKQDNRNSQTVDFFYDDIVIADATFTDQDMAVAMLLPTANGSAMTWSGGTGASDYTQLITAAPISLAGSTYVQSPTSGNPNIALFAMSDMPSSSAVLGFQGFSLVRENTSVTSADKMRIKSGATDDDTSTTNLGTTIQYLRTSIKLVDPNTGSAWTQSAINALEMGVVENNAVAVRCASVFGLVLYVPSTSTAWTKDLTEAATINANALKTPAKVHTESTTINQSFLKASTRNLRETAVINANNSPTVMDSYSESNAAGFPGTVGSSNQTAYAQSFTGNGSTLDSAVFQIRQQGSPTGNAVATIYAHSGTFGTSSVPTGSALATSDPVDVTTLTGTLALKTFSFTGVNRITLANGTKYVVAFEYTGTNSGTNHIKIATDDTNFGHTGNMSYKDSGTWFNFAPNELCFYVYGTTGSSVAELTKSLTRNLIESATMTANALKIGTKNLIESIIITATLVTSGTAAIVLTELITITDTLRKASTKILADTATITANVVKSFGRILSESIAIADIFVKSLIKSLNLVESFVVTDTLFAVKAFVRILTETCSITANVIKTSARNLLESITINDVVNKSATKNLRETASITDYLVKGMTRIITQALTLTDNLTISRVYGRILSETFTITDSIRKDIIRILLEIVLVTDILKKYLNGLLAIFSDKYTKRNTIYNDKYTARSSIYSNKYTSRGTNYSDKYTHLP